MQNCISTTQFEPRSLPCWTFTRFVLEVFNIVQRLKFQELKLGTEGRWRALGPLQECVCCKGMSAITALN